MMDALGDCPPPSAREACNVVFGDVKKIHPEFDNMRLIEVIESELERMGGVAGLGSQAGWLMMTRAALGDNVIRVMKDELNHQQNAQSQYHDSTIASQSL